MNSNIDSSYRRDAYINNEKISIIVPIYNSEKYIRYCLESLKAQDDHNFEVILVNDASTDNSVAICEEYNFTIVNLPKNKGQGVARNKGVECAAGGIICFVDSDVIASPDWVSKFRILFKKHNDASMICSGYNNSKGQTSPELFALHEGIFRRRNIPLYIESASTANSAVFKEDFQEVGGIPEYYIDRRGYEDKKAIVGAEDAELGYLLFKNGKKIVWSHENGVTHIFRNSWKGYLRQQYIYARYSVLSYIKYPERLLAKNIYSTEPIGFQLILILSMLFSVPLFIFWKFLPLLLMTVETLSFLIIFLIHRDYLLYLKQALPRHSLLKFSLIIFLTRFVWIYSVIAGLKDGIVMKFNERFIRL